MVTICYCLFSDFGGGANAIMSVFFCLVRLLKSAQLALQLS